MKESCDNQSCSCQCSSCRPSCQCQSCQSSCSGGKSEMMSEYFLELADEAWSEVLKDEIKKYISETQKGRMTELAKIVADGNNQRWKHKMEKKNACADFQEKMCNFFSQSKKS